jgi:general secretion pathway protein D
MKNNHWKIICAGALAVLLGAALDVQAQQRGSTGGFGGFGGFSGAGGNTASRTPTTATYNNNGSVGSATITVDPETHNLVVIADAETAMQISNIIASLDAPKPQVLIKVVFMELQRNDSLEIGIQAGLTRPLGNSSSTGSLAQVFGLTGITSVVTNFSGIGQPFSSTPSAPNGGFYQIVGTDFQATMKAIATAGKAQILSRPSVLARDGQLARIVVGQQVYLPSGVSFTSSGNNTTIPIINGDYQDVGIILSVTPFIGNNSLIEMILQPEITSVDTSTPGQVIATGGILGNPIYAPNINTRSADTVVITPDGQPVIIGGLIGSANSSNESRLPLLGSIPIIGNLFKYTSRSGQKNELLIFLTPHIVEAPDQLAAMTDHERANANIITNAISETELNRYLDRVPMKKN